MKNLKNQSMNFQLKKEKYFQDAWKAKLNTKYFKKNGRAKQTPISFKNYFKNQITPFFSDKKSINIKNDKSDIN